MLEDIFKRTEELTVELVKIRSVNKAPGEETRLAEFIFDYYKDLPYFKERPQQLIMQKTLDDVVSRHNTIAYVKGTKEGGSPQTVILMGHFDTVGIEDFSDFSDYATRPKELPEILRANFKLSDEVLRDIDSGKYLFGRGALDMKSGIALQMLIMEYFSRHPQELRGNIVALHTCDEEDSSKGIISSLKVLSDLREKEGFEYITSINADYTTNAFPSDVDYYVYLGTIGKYLPACSIFGKEAHVGQPFAALDPNFLAALITKNVSLNPELCDLAAGELTQPPISLKQKDFKDEYTVQTALASQVYFNVFSHGKSAEAVMRDFERIVDESMEEAIELLDMRYRKFCKMANISYTPLPWKKNIIRYEDLLREVVERNPSFLEELKAFKDRLHEREPEKDLREFNHEVIQFVWDRREDSSPGIVVYFASVLIPPLEIRGESENEKRLLQCLDEVLAETSTPAGVHVRQKHFFPYISDASFMSVGVDQSYEAYISNMPSWGHKYTHPFEWIEKIDVPVINIGSHGKDGHMFTERVDREHTFRRVPEMTYELLKKLLR